MRLRSESKSFFWESEKKKKRYQRVTVLLSSIAADHPHFSSFASTSQVILSTRSDASLRGTTSAMSSLHQRHLPVRA